jgi:hypothetical protein
LALLAQTQAPLVTTLHTVLADPEPEQARVMRALVERSARLVVMTHKGRHILRDVYGVRDRKIAVIPHGAPDRPFTETADHKRTLGLEGRAVLLTFGLLAPNKGVEHMLRALPALAKRHANALYVVLGATHPHLLAREGEAYRESLVKLSAELGISAHVCFIDEYVDEAKLLAYLAAADIYVTPYQAEAQITSGTLSFAVALGKPVVSTPYWHACELLGNGRGLITPFNDHSALATACLKLLDDDVLRERMRRKAYAAGREMTWPRVAEQYLRVFDKVRAETKTQRRRPRNVQMKTSLAGVERLTDACGILQHSLYRVPDRAHGYCLDDNARALILTNRLSKQAIGGRRVGELALIYAAFVQSAWNAHTGSFRNFMTYDRRWLEEEGSKDSFGRAFWALGETALRASTEDLRQWASDLAGAAMAGAVRLRPLRSRAFVMLGLSSLAAAQARNAAARRLLRQCAEEMAGAHKVCRRDDWKWFEDTLAYDNARLPEALIRAGNALQAARFIDLGLETLSWLCARQTAPGGNFRPVSTIALGRRNPPPDLFDQQPVEAAATIDACAAAFEASGDARWISEAERAFSWFSGANDLAAHIGLPDGQCHDGLTAAGPNRNQGAESVLAFQLATAEMRRLARLRRSPNQKRAASAGR